MSVNANWFRAYRPVSRPRLRLVCFPHAGAGPTAYRTWADLVPMDVEVLAACYPGRQDRFGEPFAPSVDALASAATAALAPLTGTPFALFGHSMGALIAYEVAVRLEQTLDSPAEHVFVSGRWTPDRVDHRNLHLADDDTLIAAVRRLGNPTGGGIDVFAVKDLRELILPVLRADYRLLSTHRRPEIVPVSAPLTAYCGDRDPGCGPQDTADWARATTGGFTMKVFPGDHFYLVPGAAELVADLSGRLSGVAAGT